MDGLFDAQHDSARKRKLTENHAGNIETFNFQNVLLYLKLTYYTYSTLCFTLVSMSRPTNAIREVFCSFNPEFWFFGFWNSTLEIRNSAPGSLDKESGIQYLKSRIHSVESRIKDFLGLPYMGRDEQNTNHETRISPQMRLTELTLSQFILFYRIIVH